ncbi:recombinase family protein [Porcincola intestinalis]|uniref:Recombinase family protein n=1 Tax=Porcincola intestinalis TaxID=2606632 RepID=A0A6L5X373_9FIRM|nr:recombinase family protein [Porcincola intestinalis]MSS13798.1 recombinase family protein [Porcincola intestinalis]
MKDKKVKCYLYMRVSTSMQVEGYSLEAQKERLTKYADFQHMEIVREYCDAGRSGKNISGRPEFTQMLQDVADDRDSVDYILVFKLSRFGRNAADVLNSLQYIQDYGVNLICVEDGIDSSKDSGKLTITVLSAVAEIERENILVQTMEGRKQKAREGRWNGGPAPFGYRLDKENDTIVVEEKDAEAVKIIYDKYVHEDMGIDTICNYLNQHGYTKNKMRRQELNYFTRSFVKRILENPVYTGKIAYGKSKTQKIKGTRDQYHRVKTDDYLLADGIHEAIISEELWEEAQQRQKEKSDPWVKTHSLDHEHLLSGIVKCPLCGAGMAGTVRRRKNKMTGEYKDDFYYRCLHRKKMDEEHFCTYRFSLNQDKLNKQVENVILDMINSKDFGGFVKHNLGQKIDIGELEEEKEQLRQKLRQLNGAKKKLTDMLDGLNVGDRHYDRKYQDMQDRLDNLYDKISDIEDEMADLNAKIHNAYAEHLTVQELYRILDHFDIMYFKMTDLEKKEFLRNLIERIELYPDRKVDERVIREIYFRFPIYYNDQETTGIRLLNDNTVETVVLLTRIK